MTRQILPGATLGILGGGQLGRMFTMAGKRLGYRVAIYCPEAESPAGQVADRHIAGDYLDADRLSEFAQHVDVVSFEFENIPIEAMRVIEKYQPIRPGPHVLHTTQNRDREKIFLHQAGLPVTRFAHAENSDQLRSGVEQIGLPCVVKTAAWGYDGKGQHLIRTMADLDNVEAAGAPWVIEAWVAYTAEVSVVAVRSVHGEVAMIGPIRNDHANHILDVSTWPADLEVESGKLQRDAHEIARAVMTKLNVVGVLCVEMFVMKDGSLMINELAPRPHNSGHLTIDAHHVSQFEQQVRSITAMPLGTTESCVPAAAMANLLGDVWCSDERAPAFSRLLNIPGMRLHLYGKDQARKGRKMGHITMTGPQPQAARQAVIDARQLLIQK